MGRKKQRRTDAAPPFAAAGTPDGVGSRRGPWWAAALLLLALVAGLGWWWWRSPAPPPAATPATVPGATASFVGAQACRGCHAEQFKDWQASQHAHAMQHATTATVLGDFGGAKFRYGDVVSTFFRRDGKYFVNTDGPDGKLADFEVRYTFGLDPLQQYLVEFPDGRLQALSIAWDARPKERGGQRWYHLYPAERIAAGDPLHWTRLNQNWNWMCADCHTTNLRRNYDAKADRYATQWSEMNVACEACHGPGSAHVAWARGGAHGVDRALIVDLAERRNVSWQPVAATGNAVRSTPLATQRELETCAQCHSRRTPLAEGMRHDGRFHETHEVALLNEFYFPDGQQRDEDYTVGSFLQSRMHAQGVTCSDCHNPHSGKPRLPGNAVCGQCHAPAKYDLAQHTMHPTGTAGAACTDCHMPTRTYMGVDPRHDHSFRIPRPDLAQALGTPDACTSCHRDRGSAWAAEAIARHFGPQRKGFQNFGPALHAAATQAPDAGAQLAAVVADATAPAIARASALAAMRPFLDANLLASTEAGLRDSDAMVRSAALQALMSAPPGERIRLALPRVDDPSRLVRLRAGQVLAVARLEELDADARARVQAAFDEFVGSQSANAERPEARVNLGMFLLERGDADGARAEYHAAVRLQPDFLPAYVNLADLERQVGREGEAQAAIEAGLRFAPADADLLHAMGLLQVRLGRIEQALPYLQKAATRAPQELRYGFVYAVALHDAGRPREAIAELERLRTRRPGDRQLLGALAAYYRESGDEQRAERYERELAGGRAAGK